MENWDRNWLLHHFCYYYSYNIIINDNNEHINDHCWLIPDEYHLNRIFNLMLNIFDVITLLDWLINKYDYLPYEYMDCHLNTSDIISEIPVNRLKN